jgi:hypothetical protein
MGIQQRLREIQDRARNAGWRIQWIPWQEPGKPEYVYNTPLTTALGLGGAGLFLLVFGSPLLGARLTDHIPEAIIEMIPIESEQIRWVYFGIGLGGLLVAFISRFYAAYRKQAKWKPITAKVIDREVQETFDADGGGSYEFRLLCRFRYMGMNYEVTPENARLVAFTSEKRANAWLAKHIGADGTCRLWIDPRNPLHAIFHKKQKI